MFISAQSLEYSGRYERPALRCYAVNKFVCTSAVKLLFLSFRSNAQMGREVGKPSQKMEASRAS